MLSFHFDDLAILGWGVMRASTAIRGVRKCQCFARASRSGQGVAVVVVHHGVPNSGMQLLLLSVCFFEDRQVREDHDGTRNPKWNGWRYYGVKLIHLKHKKCVPCSILCSFLQRQRLFCATGIAGIWCHLHFIMLRSGVQISLTLRGQIRGHFIFLGLIAHNRFYEVRVRASLLLLLRSGYWQLVPYRCISQLLKFAVFYQEGALPTSSKFESYPKGSLLGVWDLVWFWARMRPNSSSLRTFLLTNASLLDALSRTF